MTEPIDNSLDARVRRLLGAYGWDADAPDSAVELGLALHWLTAQLAAERQAMVTMSKSLHAAEREAESLADELARRDSSEIGDHQALDEAIARRAARSS